MYKEETGNVLPVKAIVLDYSPGEASFTEAFNTFSIALPKGALWYPGAAVLALWLGPLAAYKAVTGHQYLLDTARAYLNDWNLVDKDAKRLYVYSAADKLVGQDSVEKHAREAEDLGVKMFGS